MKERAYSVFVGGVEVHDYLLTLLEANRLALEWINKGYDDVGIIKYNKPNKHKANRKGAEQ